MSEKIVVIVKGGLVQEVTGIPAGCVIEVRDYDIDGRDENRMLTDESGKAYVISE
jgi:hypothetical protein